ncbi:uncharacterized protein LOC119432461 [Dermacentor silvarum]|uniref:uncharacterized protein LOC119432461 n=1 Tax=Dermacentor silvarum TaxID=543639 RepID=UPI00189A05BD|nr:uncharacterized protein LOC119432461 [Dermacentor silvarum]
MWPTGLVSSSVPPYILTVEAVYLDDILVTGTYDGDQLQNLHNVLARLQDAGLKLKLEMFVFQSPSVEYLGQVMSQAGLSPAPRKVDAIVKVPKPHNKELKSYLGLIKFYRSFLPNLPAHLQPSIFCFVMLPAGYRPGKNLRPADALSLLPLPEVPATAPEPAELFMLEHAYPEVLSRSAVSQATSHDPVLSRVVKGMSSGEELVQQDYSHKAAELYLQQDCLLWGSRVVIPQSIRSRVLQLLHAGHPGVEKTKMEARPHVW